MKQVTNEVDAAKRRDAFNGPLERRLVMYQVLHITLFVR